jgi:hypothetical protein
MLTFESEVMEQRLQCKIIGYMRIRISPEIVFKEKPGVYDR